MCGRFCLGIFFLSKIFLYSLLFFILGASKCEINFPERACIRSYADTHLAGKKKMNHSSTLREIHFLEIMKGASHIVRVRAQSALATTSCILKEKKIHERKCGLVPFPNLTIYMHF